ncbi:MAG: bifunctional ornithine acetyltransferase/N-acetylglutamate synthase, partial [Victivallales bacterium]|nr:bifunctional ornithine acetyltransferase/N-acetylglutamate synthase [Victivallales bacterium]
MRSGTKIGGIGGGGVCSPSGYKASGISAGIRRNGAADLALLYSDLPARAAGVFTSSLVKAAPVALCVEKLARGGSFRAVVVNSGVANACTGEQGLLNSRRMCDAVGASLGIDSSEVLVCSTGRIGTQLPMDKVVAGVENAARGLSAAGGTAAAMAIMTTDTRPKECAVEFEVAGRPVRIGGMAKGAGMIAPRLKRLHATMICCITTDAAIDGEILSSELDAACEATFNRISVDGDTSTNDTVLFLANGAAGNPEICPGSEWREIFREALMTVLGKLAKEIVLDGEGA